MGGQRGWLERVQKLRGEYGRSSRIREGGKEEEGEEVDEVDASRSDEEDAGAPQLPQIPPQSPLPLPEHVRSRTLRESGHIPRSPLATISASPLGSPSEGSKGSSGSNSADTTRQLASGLLNTPAPGDGANFAEGLRFKSANDDGCAC